MILLVLACADPTPGTAQDSDAPGDTGTIPAAGPWDEPDWWTLDNAGIDAILEEIPSAGFEVLYFTSDDGDAWTESPRSPIAWGFSTLGLWTTDVGLALTGFPEAAVLGVPTDFLSLYAITTTDLETFGVRAWALQGDDDETHQILVDPQVELGPAAEPRAWYYSFPLGSGDPIDIPGDHDICVARFDGQEAISAEGCPLAEEGLADPSPLFAQDARLVATTEGESITVWDLETGERRSTLDGTVPFLTHWPDGSWRLYHQVFSDMGETRVRMVDSADGGASWSEPVAPLGDTFQCTSVVAGRFAGSWVLFCARFRT